MLSKEWDEILRAMDILERRLRYQEQVVDESDSEWLNESLKLLTSKCFVWKDEFEE